MDLRIELRGSQFSAKDMEESYLHHAHRHYDVEDDDICKLGLCFESQEVANHLSYTIVWKWDVSWTDQYCKVRPAFFTSLPWCTIHEGLRVLTLAGLSLQPHEFASRLSQTILEEAPYNNITGPQLSAFPVLAGEHYKKFTLQRSSEIIPEPLSLSWNSEDFLHLKINSCRTLRIFFRSKRKNFWCSYIPKVVHV